MSHYFCVCFIQGFQQIIRLNVRLFIMNAANVKSHSYFHTCRNQISRNLELCFAVAVIAFEGWNLFLKS